MKDCQAFFKDVPEGESISQLILRLNKLGNDVDQIYLNKSDTWTILGEGELLLEKTIDASTKRTAKDILDKLNSLRFKQQGDPEGRDFDRFEGEENTLKFDSQRNARSIKDMIEEQLAWEGGDYHVTETGEVWSLDNWEARNGQE
ncbi:MAG: hypothetical protein AAFQ80_07955 [Cyanobacteria bacterium J06621_8]